MSNQRIPPHCHSLRQTGENFHGFRPSRLRFRRFSIELKNLTIGVDKEEKQVKLKPMSRWKTFGLLMVVACLLGGPMEIQAQEPNFAWITDTNGITWREKIEPPVPSEISLDWPTYLRVQEWHRVEHLDLHSDKSIAEIVVPEHARIGAIDVRGCVNLTNIILKPKQGTERFGWVDGRKSQPSGESTVSVATTIWRLSIYAFGSGLRNITAPRTMINSIRMRDGHNSGWLLSLQWTELEPEPPRIEIRTHATGNGKEMEIVWGDGTLQIADAVNGEWRDHFGVSPLRFPIATDSAKFFRIKRN